MKAELVFNLDEVGMSEWEDRKPKKVIVPKTISGDTVHHSVLRDVKYIDSLVYHGCWGVFDALQHDMAGLRASLREANASGRSNEYRSRVEAMIKAVHGRESFLSAGEYHICPLSH
jgi:hypothetical protein